MFILIPFFPYLRLVYHAPLQSQKYLGVFAHFHNFPHDFLITQLVFIVIDNTKLLCGFRDKAACLPPHHNYHKYTFSNSVCQYFIKRKVFLFCLI